MLTVQCQEVCLRQRVLILSRSATILEQNEKWGRQKRSNWPKGVSQATSRRRSSKEPRPADPNLDPTPPAPHAPCFNQLLEGLPALNHETRKCVRLSSCPVRPRVSLEDVLSGALSCSWYLLSLCLGPSSVKERVQVLLHVDIRYQLVRHLLSTIP